jgi:hypothetical protein
MKTNSSNIHEFGLINTRVSSSAKKYFPGNSSTKKSSKNSSLSCLKYSHLDPLTDNSKIRHHLNFDPITEEYFSSYQIQCEIRSRFLKNQKWHNYGFQLSINFSSEGKGLLSRIFELKGRALLLDIHDLIFNQGCPYELVFFSVRELATEFELLEEFKEWINDPVIMIDHCLDENAKQEAKEASLNSILSQIL